jgi:hypothetical protein
MSIWHDNIVINVWDDEQMIYLIIVVTLRCKLGKL